MDLRLQYNNSNMDQQVNRRPSISSMSSTSGYASSNYGGGGGGGGLNNIHPNTTGNSLLSSRVNQSRHFASLQSTSNGNLLNNQNLQFNSTWLPQQQQNNYITPWIEEQAQVSPLVNSTPSSTLNLINIQSLSMSSMPSGNLSPIVPNSDCDDEKEKLDKDDDDLIPTAIVIKNIPFAIKKEQLLDVMTKLNLPLPYAFNYHFDNGVFRGLAFANFTSTDETTMVVTQLNGREIGGRKLRVEYKKMLPVQERERIEREKREKRGQLEEQHRSLSATSLASLYSIASAPVTGNKLIPPLQQQQQQQQQPLQQPPPDRLYANLTGQIPPLNVDFNDPDTLELYSQFLLFRDDKDLTHNELAYPATLTANQRKIIPILLNYMKLTDSYENGLIIIRRKMSNSPNQLFQQNQLLRSQSHNALGLLSQLTQSLQNSRYRPSVAQPAPPPLQPQQQSPQQQIKSNFMNKSSSNLLSLRNPSGSMIPQQQNYIQPNTQGQFNFNLKNKNFIDDSLIASVENLAFN